MAITNWSELVTAIQSYMMDRTDLAANAPEFITLGEGIINYGFDGGIIEIPGLRVRDMETVVSLTPSSNVCTLPSDYIEAKRVVELASIRRPLEPITEDAADDRYPTRSSGLACHYMIIGDELTALPLSSNDIEVTYYAAVPALTASAPTNWLLTKHPGIYLRATLFQAADWLKDGSDEVTKQASMLAALVKAFNGTDNRAKFANSGTYNREPVW